MGHADGRQVGGARDRAGPNFMGLASLRRGMGIFCDSLHSVFLFNAVLGLDFLGLALLHAPQVGEASRGGRNHAG